MSGNDSKIASLAGEIQGSSVTGQDDGGASEKLQTTSEAKYFYVTFQ